MVQWHGAMLREPPPGRDFRKLYIFRQLEGSSAAHPKGLWGLLLILTRY